MLVLGGDLDVGVLAASTTVQSVDSATQITLDLYPTGAGAATLEFVSPGNLLQFVVADASVLYAGMTVTKTGGTGSLAAGTVIASISGSTVQLNTPPTGAGTATLTFGQVYGNGTTPFAYTVGQVGAVSSVAITQGGTGYEVGNLLTVDPETLVSPIDYTVTALDVIEVTFTGTVAAGGFAVGEIIQTVAGAEGGTPVTYEVYRIETAGGNITRLFLEATGGSLSNGDQLETSSNTLIGTVNTSTSAQSYYFLQSAESSPIIFPDLTLYSGNTYRFIINDTSIAALGFSLSEYPDGIHSPSNITAVSTTCLLYTSPSPRD